MGKISKHTIYNAFLHTGLKHKGKHSVFLLIYLVFVVLTLVLLPLWLFEWQLETVPKCCCEIRALFRTANILAEFPGIDW